MSTRRYLAFLLALLPLISSGCASRELPVPASPPPGATSTAPAPTPTPPAAELPAPYALIAQESIFAYLEGLTGVQPYSGWRSSATEGESEALGYAAGILSGFTHLQDLGMELERQTFRVFLATEIWESRLFLTVDGEEREVPASAVSGHRSDIRQALRFDADGELNDADRNPVEVAGQALLVRTAGGARDLAPEDAEGRIVLLDYEVIDPFAGDPGAGTGIVTALVQKRIAGLVLVVAGGHGEGAQDGTYLEDLGMTERIPMLVVRLEDLGPAGTGSWEALAGAGSARLVWDTDVFSPGHSGNLVARIPGADPSRAVLLGAHIDSANTPGAGDNALNCAVLLEVARVLNEGAVQLPVDLYLVWFGSEELGFLGSQHFVNTHQELLDRTLAAVLLDGFTAWEPGPTLLAIQEASCAIFGDPALPLTDYLSRKAEAYGVPIEATLDSDVFSSDDGPFYGFVPAIRLAYGSLAIGERFHSPYDTVESVQDQGGVMEQIALMALIAALDAPVDAPDLRVAPEPERRALVVATHTEAPHMTPTMLLHLDRALAWEGFDVDVVPYGQPPGADDLADADLVLVLPVIDYPSVEGDLTPYDEQWQADEIERLVSYVEDGGLVVLTNSAHRLFQGRAADPNEDWEDINALAARFGIRYGGIPFSTIRARVADTHPLTGDLFDLVLIADNGVPLTLEAGEVLAEVNGETAMGLTSYGDAGGSVLVLSDLGLLDPYNPRGGERDNLDFLLRLARYARGQ